MDINEQIQLWNQVITRVFDVRVKRIGRGDECYRYLMPASAFLFTAQGQGELWVDDDVWLSERFYLLHVGQGRQVTIRSNGPLDVHMVFYKASLPTAALREFHMIMQTNNPFQHNWGFSPDEPLELLERFKTLLEGWQQPDDGLVRLQAKGDFIRLVHAILRQRKQGSQPTLSEQVIRYLARNYRQMLSLEQLAQQLNYSQQYISRKFKEQLGISPMDYVTRLRMDEARELLISTTATLREISSYVGYQDLMYFNRMFKKNVGLTPGQFRNQYGFSVSFPTKNRINSSIVMKNPIGYHFIESDIHSQYNWDGANEVYRYNRSFAAIMLLCLTILVSACGGATEKVRGTAVNESATTTTNSGSNEAAPAAVAETKTVSTAFGDVEVPTHPKRVAALSYLGTVLALDLQPIAAESFLMNSPYLEGRLDGVVDVGDSIEKLLEMEPDLIITHSPNTQALEKYQKIAPTVSVPYDSFASIQDEMRYFGDLLDKREAAENWITDFESMVAKLREQIQSAVSPGETLSVMQEYDGTAFVFGPKSGRGGRIMYEILGMVPPSTIPDDMLQGSYKEFSLEKLTEFMGDYLILTTESSLETLQADPIWGKQEPIRNNRVFLWNENKSWFRDPIAVYGQINELADWIERVSSK